MSKVSEYLDSLTATELQEVELLILTKHYQVKMGNERVQLAIDDPTKFFVETTLSERPAKNRLLKQLRSWASSMDRTLLIGDHQAQNFIDVATREVMRITESNPRCSPPAVFSQLSKTGRVIGVISVSRAFTINIYRVEREKINHNEKF